ncbi:hypothetical protein MTR_8g080960 [Medicago truncatula]|uniref:Uncharacterized protein n=1 Tax=Medicago truncatula TaxID=3880 RepID=A0A072TSZ0_MEDTR|nr:hypothetical protein MTR_8g080960 [Medicago truncatula]
MTAYADRFRVCSYFNRGGCGFFLTDFRVRLCIRVGGRISHLHEVWLYITSGVSKSSSVYLMLDCLARKRRYTCCCRDEFLVL